MCGIFGMAFLKGSKIDNSGAIRLIIRNLFALSQERGRRATGIAIINSHEAVVLKKDIPAHEFIVHPTYLDFVASRVNFDTSTKANGKDPLIIVGHCRQDTKGSPTNNNNNHPIVANKIIGVHNGHIRNDDYLFRIFADMAPPVKRRAEVDSEIIFRLIDHFSDGDPPMRVVEAIQKTSSLLEGNYACAMVSVHNPYSLFLFRKYNPISVSYYPDSGILIFASVHRYILKATGAVKLGNEFVIETMNEPTINGTGKGMVVNTCLNKFHSFDLKPVESGSVRSGEQNWAEGHQIAARQFMGYA